MPYQLSEVLRDLVSHFGWCNLILNRMNLSKEMLTKIMLSTFKLYPKVCTPDGLAPLCAGKRHNNTEYPTIISTQISPNLVRPENPFILHTLPCCAKSENDCATDRCHIWQTRFFEIITVTMMSAMASQLISLTSVYSTIYSGVDQRKHQSSASLAFVRGIHRGPVN